MSKSARSGWAIGILFGSTLGSAIASEGKAADMGITAFVMAVATLILLAVDTGKEPE